jgi:hypothetical protein
MNLFFIYIIFYAITLLIGGLFCIGLWISSQGEDEIQPDGKLRNVWAMIFYPIHRYLDRKKTEFIYYSGEQLEGLIEQFKADYKQYMGLTDVMEITKNGFKTDSVENADLWEKAFVDLYKRKQIIYMRYDLEFDFCKEYETPIISPYISKPLLLCFKCFASIWGSLVFWAMTLFALRVDFIPCDFYVLVPMWVLYCFNLVVVNVKIEKKTS